jgi:hypothetical protein
MAKWLKTGAKGRSNSMKKRRIFDCLKGAKSGTSFALRRDFIKRTFVASFWVDGLR